MVRKSRSNFSVPNLALALRTATTVSNSAMILKNRWYQFWCIRPGDAGVPPRNGVGSLATPLELAPFDMALAGSAIRSCSSCGSLSPTKLRIHHDDEG